MSLNGNIKMIKTEKRIVERQRSSEKNRQKQFPQLQINDKTKHTKEELIKRKRLSKAVRNEISTIVIDPKITKNKKKISKNKTDVKLFDKKKNIDSNIEDWINRQNKWMENKTNKLNRRIVTETLKKMENCVFEPKINKGNRKIFINLNTKSHKIIKSPDSYMNYIIKNEQFRKNKSNSKIKENHKAKKGKSLNKGKNKMLKINKLNDYDYTKHQLTERNNNLSISNYNNNTSISISSKSFYQKEKEKARRSVPLSKLKLTNLTEDELYNMIYLNEKDKMDKELIDFTSQNEEIIFKGKEQIHFKQAMEKLHIALININLDDVNNTGENSYKDEKSIVNLKGREDNSDF